jgi:hypothetical protein
MKLNSLPLPPFYNILVIVLLSTLPKYPWSLLCRRVNIYFVGKEDIRLKVLYYLVLILLAILGPLFLVFLQDFFLYKHVLVDLTTIGILF